MSIVFDYENEIEYADKTFAEIEAAFVAGCPVVTHIRDEGEFYTSILEISSTPDAERTAYAIALGNGSSFGTCYKNSYPAYPYGSRDPEIPK